MTFSVQPNCCVISSVNQNVTEVTKFILSLENDCKNMKALNSLPKLATRNLQLTLYLVPWHKQHPWLDVFLWSEPFYYI